MLRPGCGPFEMAAVVVSRLHRPVFSYVEWRTPAAEFATAVFDLWRVGDEVPPRGVRIQFEN